MSVKTKERGERERGNSECVMCECVNEVVLCVHVFTLELF